MPPKNPTSTRFCSPSAQKRKNGVEPSPLQEAVGGGGRTIRRRGPGDVFTSTGKPPRPAPNPSRPLSVPLPAGPGAPPLATLARAGPHVSAGHAPNRRETSSLVHPKPPDPKCTNASSPPCHSPKVLCSALVWQDPTQAGGDVDVNLDEKRAPKRATGGPISHGGHGGVCDPIELTAEVQITILAAHAGGGAQPSPAPSGAPPPRPLSTWRRKMGEHAASNAPGPSRTPRTGLANRTDP